MEAQSEMQIIPKLPGVRRWTACETYTWVAFGEARTIGDHVEFPKKEWSRDWKHWPPKWLSNAFVEIETGKFWEPDLEIEFGLRADAVRACAREIIEETGETARQLKDTLASDIEQCECNMDKLRRAYREVMTAVREGRLRVWARPTFEAAKPNISAVHEVLDPLLFEGPRGVGIFGKVDYIGTYRTAFDPRRENDFGFLDYKGPWFDEARFDAEQAQALWPWQSGMAVSQTSGPATKKRPQGFDYATDDAPLVELALTGIADGSYLNATDAARAQSSQAKGHGNLDSKMKRLLGRIQSRSGAEQD